VQQRDGGWRHALNWKASHNPALALACRLELLQPAYDKWFKTDEERRAPFGSSHTAVAYAELLAAALGGLQAEQEAPQADKQQQQAPLLQQQPQPQPQPQQPQQQQPQPPQQQKQQQAPG